MYRKPNYFTINILALLILEIFLLPAQINAIPVFARKYRTSCSTCHVAFTKRNIFGESFRRNGYIMPIEDTRMTKEKSVKLGAEEWKELWPETIWPGSIPETFPMAAYSIFRINYNPADADQGKGFEFDMPLLLNFVFGGNFGESVSFFGGWSAYAFGQNAVGLQRLFFQFNSVVGTKNLFNIRIGRFEPGITDGYTSNQKLTLSYPITTDYNAASPVTGQGGWRPRDYQSGIELNGIVKKNIYYAAGIVNGESKTIGDPTDQKDIYVRLAYDFSKSGFDGQVIDSGSVDMDNSLYIGVYSYWGSRNKIPANNKFYDNRFNRYGCDLTWHIHKFDLLSGVIYGVDDNPNNDFRSVESLAYFFEGNYSFYPWLIGVLRLEHASLWRSNEDIDKFYNIIPNITVMYRANIRFSLEGAIRIDENKNVQGVTIQPNNEYPLQSITLNAALAF